jgi:hypothetical protein
MMQCSPRVIEGPVVRLSLVNDRIAADPLGAVASVRRFGPRNTKPSFFCCSQHPATLVASEFKSCEIRREHRGGHE